MAGKPIKLASHSQLDAALPVPAVQQTGVTGEYVRIEGQRAYRIANCHEMPEFFISLVSSGNHWMFISSRGALTAGRINPDQALFPYYSADKISDLRHCTGPLTVIRDCSVADQVQIWQPFSAGLNTQNEIRQNLYKNETGNILWLEEINDQLGLVFRYRWAFGNRFGFIRSCHVENLNARSANLQVLDGLQNLLPSGIDQSFQLRFSNLADAYKKSELDPVSQMGMFFLSSIPTDKAEPSEGLRASVVWQTGLEDPEVLLSNRQVSRFVKTGSVSTEHDIRAHRGAYLLVNSMDVPARSCKKWTLVAELNQDQTDVANLKQTVTSCSDLVCKIEQDVADCQSELQKILASSDSRQLGSDSLRTHRHQTNVLFNLMRGGYPAFGYLIDSRDFARHLQHFNSAVYERQQSYLSSLPARIDVQTLLQGLTDQNEPDLLRIGLEYLPFTFGRRHGDPTRPWNRFEIRLEDEFGEPDLNYQGNWRDIFQNWEALSVSWPRFATGMVFRFVNSSTADGYNPYRVTKQGIEWEAPDPDDPWANIGYWGDHQIVYLLKLLEWTRRFSPEALDQWLDSEYCTYTQVPYRIRSFQDICNDPRDTIEYDFQLASQITERVDKFGEDGKLLQNRDGGIYRATLGEKLLVPALAKMTNFVPEGGIWLNTQRPEWNDANNALAGYGLSVVTVCYLRRYFAYLRDWFTKVQLPQFLVSTDIVQLMNNVQDILTNHQPNDEDFCDNSTRLNIVNALSHAGSQYRDTLYNRGLSGEKQFVSTQRCRDLFNVCIAHLDQTIQSNRRSDGLYHSYNLINLDTESGAPSCSVEHLFEMLEGQVAVLGSGTLSSDESVNVLDALRASEMYREDQNSFMLYPDRVLARFDEKNTIDAKLAERSSLAAKLLECGDQSIIRKDIHGELHFCGDFRNSLDLDKALDKIASDIRFATFGSSMDRERAIFQEYFESTFSHRFFTGRSGTFFGYEGLGSIYWHMVSKLVLATQEQLLLAIENESSIESIECLQSHYVEIREGTGVKKEPTVYGAIPTDPYSHTPRHAGAQQPGMTGQVKEDVLARLTEVGLRIQQGVIRFEPALFDTKEFLQTATSFDYFDVAMSARSIELDEGSFAFTVCQLPVIYRQGPETKITIHWDDETVVTRSGNSLTHSESRQVFDRDGAIQWIEISFAKDMFRTF